jgi:hypothetical protein
MEKKTRKRNPWIKRSLIAGLVLLIAAGAIYWYVATEKFSDTKDRKSAYTVNAVDFIREFQQDDSAANRKYIEKIITVNGTVSELEAPDTTTVNVKFIDPSTGAFAIFAFQEQHRKEAMDLKVGDSISIKGACSGVTFSDILGVSYITFKRSTLSK